MVCIGIIGGHGYNAAIELQYYIAEEITNTRKYIKTIVINDATVNNDSETTLDLYQDTADDAKIAASIYNAYNSLVQLGCDIITIPCNTYSNMLSKIKSDVKIINIIDVTCDWVKYRFPTIKKIGLIGTQQTIHSRYYHDRLPDHDIICFDELKDDINSIILCAQYGFYKKNPDAIFSLKYKIGEPDLVKTMNKIIDKFKKNGVNHLILGCTELPLFVKYNKLNDMIFIDTMEVLAKNIMSLADSHTDSHAE